MEYAYYYTVYGTDGHPEPAPPACPDHRKLSPPAEKKKECAMDLRRIDDWTLLIGSTVEMRRRGITVCSGYVDAVTEDGTILWLQAPTRSRQLYEKAELYEAWAGEDRPGLHYRVQAARHLDTSGPAK
jgi:hypothetical protein